MRIDNSCVIWMVITGIIILLPMVWGLMKWNSLPERMAVHFGFDGKPNGFASRKLVVFGLPLVLLLTQLAVFFTFCLSGAVEHQGIVIFIIAMLIVPLAGAISFIVIYKKALKG